MKALFIAALFLCFGIVGAVQWMAYTYYSAGMQEALQPVNCLRDVPRVVLVRGEL